ncbi:MAG: phytanoyl-CoA dioxygenase family protein [Alphaproteobacteria bacterium]
MTDRLARPNPILTGRNAVEADVYQPWEQDNQAWWDWYVSLAENDGEAIDSLIDAGPVLPSVEPASEMTVKRHLTEPFDLSPDDVAFFAENGFVKIKGVIAPDVMLRLRRDLVSLLEQAFAVTLDGGARDRFFSLDMVWLDHAIIRAFVLSPRIAGICAGLLDVPRVRLYHDNVLSKEPGCGRTPWHYDDHHFPLATHDVVTAWIPAQAIPRAMGPLAFAKPIDAYKYVEDLTFNKHDTSYDREVAESFRAKGVAVEDGPFEIGEVSFHHNLSFHTAAANRTDRSRIVLANTYFADGARVVDQPTMVSGDWQKFIPGTQPGAVVASPLNPICWPPSDALAALAVAGVKGLGHV